MVVVNFVLLVRYCCVKIQYQVIMLKLLLCLFNVQTICQHLASIYLYILL